MAAQLYDRVKVATATTGTGTITLGSAVRSSSIGDYLTFAEAGIADGTLVSYFIQDGANWASGQGTYTASGTTLSRDASEKCWNGSAYGTAALSLSGSAVVYIGARAADLVAGAGTLPSVAIAAYATSPTPVGGVGTEVWSTTVNAPLVWNGTAWTPGGTTGTGVVNFGSFPGSSDTTLVITGQTGILSTSRVRVWIEATATTDHSADEHWVESLLVTAGNIVVGTGFTIYAKNYAQSYGNWPQHSRARNFGCDSTRLYGQFTVGWEWYQ